MPSPSGIWPDGGNGEKEIVVCMGCGEAAMPWARVFHVACSDGGLHGPTQTVPVLPASLADELAETLQKSAEAHHGLSGELEHLKDLFPDCQDQRCAEARKTLAHYRAVRGNQPSTTQQGEGASRRSPEGRPPMSDDNGGELGA